MNPKTLVEIQLRKIFHSDYKKLLVQGIKEHIENGFWDDEFGIVFDPLVPDRQECEQLLEILFDQFENFRIDQTKLERAINEGLWSLPYRSNDWFVFEDSSYIVTDGLLIAKFSVDTLIWLSPRISIDGIDITEATETYIDGFAWLGSEDYRPDSPFRIDCLTGKLIRGESLLS